MLSNVDILLLIQELIVRLIGVPDMLCMRFSLFFPTIVSNCSSRNQVLVHTKYRGISQLQTINSGVTPTLLTHGRVEKVLPGIRFICNYG